MKKLAEMQRLAAEAEAKLAEAIKQGNVERISTASEANATRDLQANLAYKQSHDNILMYNNNIENEILKRVKFANALTFLALGVPFIHMGQEIGMSKFGLDNSYNVLNVNSMDWKLVKKRYPMVKYLGDLITLRKQNDFILNVFCNRTRLFLDAFCYGKHCID